MTVPLLIAAIAAVTLEGRVVGPAGAPVAGAQIKVFGPQDAGGESTGEPAQTGATAEDGAFSFAGLARGTYVLQVSAPGLAPLEIGSVRVPGRARDVELVKGAPLRGAVYDAVTRALIAEARVEIASENGLPALASVRTGKRGELEIPALAPGSYNIVVKARGYAPEPRSVTIGGGEAAPFNVSLQKGAVLDVLVQGGDGAASRAVDRARVTLSCATTGSGVRADGEGTTGKDGKIVIESAPACDRYLATVRAAGWKSIERVQVMASQAGKDGARKVVIKLEKGVGISGRTVDEAGSPLASVSVWASGQAASGFALSDAAGAFRIDGLEPGKTSIWATLDGYIPEQEQELELGARGVSGKTLVLRSGRSASGHVHDGARHPVAGAEITIDSMETQSTGISDEAGAFTITGLGDGELTITVRAAGYQLLMTKANDGADLDLVLAHGSLLRGRILDAASGEGIGGGQVGVMPIAEGGGADMEAMGQYEGEGEDGFGAKSDASGAFELTGLKAGRFTLLAVATGYVYAVLPEVEILDGQDREGVVIKLERGGSVSGTVVRDKDGAPIAGAQVVISEDEGGLGTVAPAFTDARGRFRMEGLSGKRATLSVSHPEYASRDVEIALAEHGETAGAVVKLSAGARLKGIVMAGGVPLSGASVSAESGNTVTDASGSFDLDHLPAGLVRLYVSAPYRGGEEGSPPIGRSQDVEIADGETASIVIDLEAGARITGRLLHRGRPVSGGNVGIQDPAGWGPNATVDADGTFLLKGVHPGSCRLIASSGALRTQKDIVMTDDDLEITVEFPASGMKGVVVEAGSGRPVAGASVYTREGEGGGWGSPTDAEGAFDLEGVPAGTYTLRAAAEEHQNASVTVTVAEGEVVEGIRIELPGKSENASTLAGKVVGADGRPAFPAMVGISSSGETENEVMTDGTGHFSIPDVAAGTYDVMAVQFGGGYGPAIRRGVVVSDATPSLELTLPREAILKVTVRRGGAPLPGVTVALAGPGLDALGPFTSLSDETDRDGVAMLPGLPAGTFTIRVTSGMETREAPVSLEAGRQTEIVIGF